MTTDHRLSPTYAQARREVLAAAARVDATVASFAHPAVGREGEELAIDVITVGPDDADSVMVIVSGTHGVEGYSGSALQRWWLDERANTLPPSVRVVLIHAFNPVGFSWVRRVNEDNVDLNRNFVDWSQPAPSNDAYGEIADLLVPTEWNDTTQAATMEALLAVAADVGMVRFQEIISGGQYGHPSGVFYGGSGPVWSHRWAAEHLPQIVGTASRCCIIDLHTGLGPWGHGELISVDPVGSAEYERGTAWWGDIRAIGDAESVSADLMGDWLNAVPAWLTSTEITKIAIEYGTVDVITVLQSLRADAWLHAYGDPTADSAAAIRDQVRAAFVDDDPAWLAATIERFDSVSSDAIAQLSN